MIKAVISATVVGLVVACARPIVQGGTAQRMPIEQWHFAVEGEEVRSPLPLPPAILRVLAQDADVRRVLASQNISPDQLPNSWFTASEVQLSSSDARSVVVIGQSYLVGANVTTFWIFRPDGRQYELIFKGAAHDLDIVEAQSHGYRSLKIVAISADRIFTNTFEFNGKKYELKTSASEAIQ